MDLSIEISIRPRNNENGPPGYDVIMRGRLPGQVPGDDDGPCDLVVTLQMDAAASLLVDAGAIQIHMERRI
jgi:hypothetical protein